MSIETSSASVAKASCRPDEPGSHVATEARDVLAAKHFPQEWARFATKPGASKQRQKLRKSAEIVEQVMALSAAGAKCGNCSSFNTRHVQGADVGAICEYHTDFHGYVRAKADELCAAWTRREATPTPQAGSIGAVGHSDEVQKPTGKQP